MMKSENRVKGYKPGTDDWKAAYNMLLDDGVTCNQCIHVERCCAIFGQRPYVNEGRCQFYPNRFKEKAPASSSTYICPVCKNEDHPTDAKYCKICGTIIGAASPEPLTLEQLREMVGNPVWVSDLLIESCSDWHFVEVYDGEILLFNKIALARKIVGYNATTGHNYGKTWLAYQYKPEGK